jgi:hypothetical protein
MEYIDSLSIRIDGKVDSHKLMLDVTHILLVKDEMKSAGRIEG